MTDLLPFIVIGVSIGSLYGLAALGLVLTYRTSGVFNLAHGAVAAAAAYFFHTLHYKNGWSWPIAGVCAVGLFGPVAGVVMERVARGLAATRQATIIVGTLGLMLLIQGFLYWHYGTDQYLYPEFLPTDTAVTISGVIISWAQVIKFAIGIVTFATLTLFLRRARLGIAMRAVVGADDLLSLTGTSPARVRVASWIIGCSVAALTGVLIAPNVGLDAFLLTALVVQAFGAVSIGRFTSLPFTYLGGLVVGVVAAVAQKYLGSRPPLNGLPTVVPFLVLIVVMLVTPPRLLPKGAGRFSGSVSRTWPIPRSVRVAATLAAGGLLAFIPQLVGSRVPAYSVGLIFAILFLSLSLLTRVSGQISLAHAAFLGVGAAAFSHVSVEGGYPWVVGVAAAGVITAALGAILALPAIRLSGIYLALATFGFGLLMENVVFHTWLLFGTGVQANAGAQGGLRGTRPVSGFLDGSDTSFYYVILVVALLATLILVALRRSRGGRFLRAMADSPTALVTMGLGLNVARTMIFSISAFFAGIAGALYISQIGQLTALSFQSTSSLLYLAVLTVAGTVAGFVPAAFLAGGLLVVLPSYMTSITVEVQSMLFGGIALLAALVSDGRIQWRALGERTLERLHRAAAASEGRRDRSPVRARSAHRPVAVGGGQP